MIEASLPKQIYFLEESLHVHAPQDHGYQVP